jgi:hypothetical protein
LSLVLSLCVLAPGRVGCLFTSATLGLGQIELAHRSRRKLKNTVFEVFFASSAQAENIASISIDPGKPRRMYDDGRIDVLLGPRLVFDAEVIDKGVRFILKL